MSDVENLNSLSDISGNKLYDEPEIQKTWSHEYTEETVVVHQLKRFILNVSNKRSDYFIKAFTYFFPEIADKSVYSFKNFNISKWENDIIDSLQFVVSTNGNS